MDIDSEEREVISSNIGEDGSLDAPVNSSYEELEKHLANVEIPPKVFLKEKVFEDLRRIFGKNVEILVNY